MYKKVIIMFIILILCSGCIKKEEKKKEKKKVDVELVEKYEDLNNTPISFYSSNDKNKRIYIINNNINNNINNVYYKYNFVIIRRIYRTWNSRKK